MKTIASGLVLAISLATTYLAQAHSAHRSEFTRWEACEDRDPGDLAPYLEVCEGPDGREVWFAYSEHSSAMAIGPSGIELQMSERPPVEGLEMIIGPVIDWRYAGDGTQPYAAIVRYRGLTPVYDQDRGEFTGEIRTDSNVLAVIALRNDGPVSACHIAYLDVLQLPHANERAHTLAANHADSFRCGEDAVRYIDGDNPLWD